mgnify:CR=1 FL=1
MTAEIKQPEPRPHAYQPSEALALFYYLCDAYRRGLFTFREFSQALNALRFIDADKNIWTIGSKSGKWYKLRGTEWIEDQPTGLMASVDEMLWYDHIKKLEEPEGNICRECGRKLDKDSRFCSNCATPVENKINSNTEITTENLFCRNCGAPLNADSKFCTRCGTARR